jgi:hypothetical protein
MTTCAFCGKKDEEPKYAVSYWISRIAPAENPEILHVRCVDPFIALKYPDKWIQVVGEEAMVN